VNKKTCLQTRYTLYHFERKQVVRYKFILRRKVLFLFFLVWTWQYIVFWWEN